LGQSESSRPKTGILPSTTISLICVSIPKSSISKIYSKEVRYYNIISSKNTEFKEDGPYFYELEKMSLQLERRLQIRNLIPKIDNSNKIR
jgi:hypothetical protein